MEAALYKVKQIVNIRIGLLKLCQFNSNGICAEYKNYKLILLRFKQCLFGIASGHCTTIYYKYQQDQVEFIYQKVPILHSFWKYLAHLDFL